MDCVVGLPLLGHPHDPKGSLLVLHLYYAPGGELEHLNPLQIHVGAQYSITCSWGQLAAVT